LVDFFIDRPIFASVLAILITLAGAVCIPLLPIAQFPPITPPTVQISASYTGASAEVVESSVTVPIEQQVNGVEGMMYMASNSSNDGSMSATVTFEVGYDLNIAAVDVQNRVQIAQPQLPEEVQRQGVRVTKQSTDLTLVVNLISPDGSRDNLFLSNYAGINVTDRLKRLPGVGQVTQFGERRYSMRIWLLPAQLAKLGINAQDVIGVLREQNQQVAAGAIGQPPAPEGQQFQYTLTAKGRLTTVEEFEQIVVRTRPDGSVLRLKDVARVELGAESYGGFAQLGRLQATGIGVYSLPTANALDVAKAVRAEMDRLSQRFPSGVQYAIVYDTTLFVTESVKEVLSTLVEAMLLVFLVVFVFLQSFRATLIPAITVPVSLIGTFALMQALGFSINTLTLFGLVLAIGLVVDDAIVVVENVERIMEEKQLPAKEATKVAMREVTGPIIAISLVLMAVFLPVAFVPGTTGRLYQQFALTIACSVAISALNALTLSPALCALLLRARKPARPRPFAAFDRGFHRFTDLYERLGRASLARRPLALAAFAVLLVATAVLYQRVPRGFVPAEDLGYFIVSGQLPDGASLERTEHVTQQILDALLSTPGVRNAVVIGGFNVLLGTQNPNAVACFAALDPWHERSSSELRLAGILARVRPKLSAIPDALVSAFNPPPIRGLGSTGGFQLQLEDIAGGSLANLARETQALIDEAERTGVVTSLVSTFRANVPQYAIDIDRTKVKALGLTLTDVFAALQTYLGGYYVNDFNRFGRVYRVFVQAEGDVRSRPEDVSQLYARNARGEMVPLGTLATVQPIVGPQTISHFNLFRTAAINGEAARGRSSGQAIAAMEKTAERVLPDTMGYEWTGLVYQELKAGGQAPILFGLALVVVFLCLAALYESWSLPFTVMLVVPLAVFGALVALSLRGLVNDVFCQIGLVMLVGLASKNAILIVEFAKLLHDGGASVVDAAIRAARVRLRPILMTSLAFILGVLPLVLATGAGAAARHSLGTAVFGGMIAATFLSLAIVPVFFAVVEGLRVRVSRARRGAA
jgi:hydrophobe/amphiphile efflux-1 (HAE1) family protein